MQVTVREKGRITLPARIREALALKEGDRLQVLASQGMVILRPTNVVSVDSLAGILRIARVELEETERALGALN